VKMDWVGFCDQGSGRGLMGIDVGCVHMELRWCFVMWRMGTGKLTQR